MSENFSYLDKFTPEELANFKEASRLKAVESQHAQPFVLEAASAKRRSRIIAEGDSWFDYLPGSDLIDCLRNLFDYDIEKFAKAGDTLENMIYGTDINRQFQREVPQIHTIMRRIEQIKPRVFLFSGVKVPLFLRKLVLGIPAQASGKNYAAANASGGPSRPASFVGYPARGIPTSFSQ
jgi:hypothetical protein